MKKVLLILISLIITMNLSAQDLPMYYIQNGDTIGIVYSIQQAQRIYNEQIILDLLKGVRKGCDSLTKRYLVIVNRYEQKQIIDRTLINEYEKNIKEQTATINQKDDKIILLEKNLQKSDDQKKLKDDEIAKYGEIIGELKKQRSWLLGGTIGFGALSLFLLGSVLVN